SAELDELSALELVRLMNAEDAKVIPAVASQADAIARAVEGIADRLRARGRLVYVGGGTSGRLGVLDASASPATSNAPPGLAPVVGPEVLSGSTRLKAGTATKFVLNMLSTGAMVRLGKTYGNLMVDLRATNEKLRLRTNRIVREATGLDRAAADELLDKCDR